MGLAEGRMQLPCFCGEGFCLKIRSVSSGETAPQIPSSRSAGELSCPGSGAVPQAEHNMAHLRGSSSILHSASAFLPLTNRREQLPNWQNVSDKPLCGSTCPNSIS